MNTLILIQCSDKVGLVALVTRILAEHNLNITEMREFVDETASLFFTRIECQGLAENQNLLFQELKIKLPENAVISINPKKEKRVALLVTKEYHCLGDALTRHCFNNLGANICCVIGNYETLKSFTERFDVPFHYVDHQEKSKEQFEEEILQILATYNPDYLVLAKFMRILSPQFVANYPYQIINIHHSFLPAFVGAHPYRQAFQRGVKLIGATAHFVTNDLDEGPIIAQEITPINHTFTVNDMVIAGKEVEKSVLSKAMTLVFEDRVFVTGNKTIVFE
ncbi:formyltetrahydrofolate deformylase [Rubrolithibacter danxiaensis]|uniref:formyltetrahydrofolate deformylase n=1 Tax=Rubrolithibacter danxiaensis TaxID=3390805 RepID=UPI003BF7D985